MELEILFSDEDSGGVSDHGALTGLGDDDHPQYTLTAEAQALADAAEADAIAAAAASLAAHTGDPADAHAATAIGFTPNGSIAATNVQDAIQEVRDEAAVAAAALTVKEEGAVVDVTVSTIDFAGADFDVTESPEDEVNVVISAAIARQAALDAHINDGTDAHDASSVSVDSTDLSGVGTDVQTVLEELEDQIDAAAITPRLALTDAITQAAHGLAVGDVVKLSGSNTYAKAQANSEANAEVVGIVSAVADVNNFTLHFYGIVTGLSGLVAGSVYYLDDDTAGLLTATEPPDVGDISKPVLIARTTTSGFFVNYRGMVQS